MRRLLKRPWVWVLAAALGCGLVFAVTLLLLPTGGITPTSFDRIGDGMTRQEVEQILGEPPTVSSRSPSVFSDLSDRECWWFSDRFVIYVTFDVNGRVIYKAMWRLENPWYRRWPVVRQVAEYCGW